MRDFIILLGTVTGLVGIVISPALPGMGLEFQDVPDADFLVRLTLTFPAVFVAITAPVWARALATGTRRSSRGAHKIGGLSRSWLFQIGKWSDGRWPL